ncbi:MAG: FAD-binding protein [Bacteroidales bacterium]|nr:FAD-binding protein [Bacteroidales bacterium]
MNRTLFLHAIRSGGFKGELHTDGVYRTIYATDASAYREQPLAVACPCDADDIRLLIAVAGQYRIGLIPRAGGTSLAGQVVGNGVVVDVSRHMTRILEINIGERWAWVEPGVILDELNRSLQSDGIFFAPETSTSNRCTIGGMTGNNSCGSHSLVYGSTRDHLIEIKALLSDGSEVRFSDMTATEFEKKMSGMTMENSIYLKINELLSNPAHQSEIRAQFPKENIRRRNNGYAVDYLLDTIPFGGRKPFNLCPLIAGSEGTLVFITAVKIKLSPLPAPFKAVVCIHLHSVEEALRANPIALQHQPEAVELMDRAILNCSKENLLQQRNRFFVQGDPGAILIVEFAGDDEFALRRRAGQLEESMKAAGFGYHFPFVSGDDVNKVWALRKAGLGALSNMRGDAKPVSVVEDTAIAPEDMPDYIADFKTILDKYGLSCVYHAHIATGELHLRPVLNLKKEDNIRLFRTIAQETALLVKKYRGSLSGEHGDGRLRGEFIPLMYGSIVYQLFKEIKHCFDPNGIFNPGKIVDTPPMDTSLRYIPSREKFQPLFDYSTTYGMVRSVENCNGSGDCRKLHTAGGTMCPSYMATYSEYNCTRARANLLREYLTCNSDAPPFAIREVYEILDLCLSCKGCKSECPSGVDMTKLKAEFLQHYYDDSLHGRIPLRTWMIAHINRFNRIGCRFPALFNLTANSFMVKKMLGFELRRNIPHVVSIPLRKWGKSHLPYLNEAVKRPTGNVLIFIDEFSNYHDVALGKKTILLLHRLGYRVEILPHEESGRTYLSKGLLRKARKIAEKNVHLLASLVGEEKPLVGIEPSCILSFRDEYPELVSEPLRKKARQLAQHCLTIEEFIVKEFERLCISSEAFTDASRRVFFHGHCYQKSLTTTQPTRKMLSIPVNYTVCELKTGCCGMAGAFGYEKEHYELSMRIGELSLFPQVRQISENDIIAASGTSCRQHIAHGTGRTVIHPVEALYDALKPPDTEIDMLLLSKK